MHSLLLITYTVLIFFALFLTLKASGAAEPHELWSIIVVLWLAGFFRSLADLTRTSGQVKNRLD